jgi:hypothetical protein
MEAKYPLNAKVVFRGGNTLWGEGIIRSIECSEYSGIKYNIKLTRDLRETTEEVFDGLFPIYDIYKEGTHTFIFENMIMSYIPCRLDTLERRLDPEL